MRTGIVNYSGRPSAKLALVFEIRSGFGLLLLRARRSPSRRPRTERMSPPSCISLSTVVLRKKSRALGLSATISAATSLTLAFRVLMLALSLAPSCGGGSQHTHCADPEVSCCTTYWIYRHLDTVVLKFKALALEHVCVAIRDYAHFRKKRVFRPKKAQIGPKMTHFL